jgi:uncharacterized OB-fold protein
MHDDFPLPDTAWPPLAPFWAAAAEGELRIPRCDRCAHLEWYPRETCSACAGDTFTWSQVSGRATLFSWSVVTHAWVPQFAEQLPLVAALVALVEDPAVRLATRIVDATHDSLSVDMPVDVAFRDLRFAGSGRAVVVPFFRPRAGSARPGSRRA